MALFLFTRNILAGKPVRRSTMASTSATAYIDAIVESVVRTLD
jgi:hypothetical protein